MIKNWLCKHLCKPQVKNIRPQYLEDIGFTEIYTILKAAYPECPIYIGDREYKTTSVIELKRFLRDDLTDIEKYVDEYFDCEDFSFRLMGNLSNPAWGSLPFGIMWTQRENDGAHAVNLFIDNNREVWIVEPQNDNMFKMPNTWHPYLIII